MNLTQIIGRFGVREKSERSAVIGKLFYSLFTALILLLALDVRGQAVKVGSGEGGLQSPEVQLVEAVTQRLLAAVDTLPSKYKDKQINQFVWPPPVWLINSPQLEAYTTRWYMKNDQSMHPVGDWVIGKDDGKDKILPVERMSGKFYPYIVLSLSVISDPIEGEADRLALFIGHELGHILLGHVLDTSPSDMAQTKTISNIYSQEEELAADLLGMKLALAAGYSYEGARSLWLRIDSEEFRTKTNGEWNFSSFEGLPLSHPSESERMEHIDKEKESIWRAMVAFENGVFFLGAQQYAAAEECFLRVVDRRAFPDSYEAWANLGYARLMRYLDSLNERDLRRYGVGQLVVGSFYVRKESLRAKVRGVPEAWDKAVEALRKALELRPDLALVKANLGVAYLLSSMGKNTAEASKYLEQAVTEAMKKEADKNLVPRNKAAILINAAVALTADGREEAALRRLEQAEDLIRDDEMLAVLKYNRALLWARGSDHALRKKAVAEIESYLESTSPASLWWRLGYERYVELSRRLGFTPKSRQEMEREQDVGMLRRVTSVRVAPRLLVTLSDRVDLVKRKLGIGHGIPVMAGSNLVQMIYRQRGVKLLANRGVVVAIFLRGKSAPPLQIRRMGIGSKAVPLRVGIRVEEVEAVLGKDSEREPLLDPMVEYDYYPEAGVAIKYNGEKRVEELVVIQVSEEWS